MTTECRTEKHKKTFSNKHSGRRWSLIGASKRQRVNVVLWAGLTWWHDKGFRSNLHAFVAIAATTGTLTTTTHQAERVGHVVPDWHPDEGSRDKQKLPWFSVLRRQRQSGNDASVCHGALVSSRHVLTLQHCFDALKDDDDDEYQVEVGFKCGRRNNCGQYNAFVGVERVQRHDPSGLALVVLDETIFRSRIRPAVPYLRRIAPLTNATTMPSPAQVSSYCGSDETATTRLFSSPFTVGGSPQHDAGNRNTPVATERVECVSTQHCLERMRLYSSMEDSFALNSTLVFCTSPSFGNCPRYTKDSSPSSSIRFVVAPGAEDRQRHVIWGLETFTSVLPADELAKDEDDTQNQNCTTDTVWVNIRLDHDETTRFLEEVICEGAYYPEDWCQSATTTKIAATRVRTLLSVDGGSGTRLTKVAFNMDGSRLVAASRHTGPTPIATDDSPSNIYEWNPFYTTAGISLSHLEEASFSNPRKRMREDRTTAMTFPLGIQVWNMSSASLFFQQPSTFAFKPLFNISVEDDWINTVQFNPIGNIIASDKDGVITLWNAFSGAALHRLQHSSSLASSSGVSALTWHADGIRLVAAFGDGSLVLWNVRTGEVLDRRARGHDRFIHAVSFRPHGDRRSEEFATGSSDSTIKVWSLTNSSSSSSSSSLFHPHPPLRLVSTLVGHSKPVLTVAYSPNGELLASGSQDGTVKIWRMSNASACRTFVGHQDLVTSVAWSPDCTFVVSASEDSTLRVWKVLGTQEEPVLVLEQDDEETSVSRQRQGRNGRGIQSVDWSPNGSWIVAATNRKIQTWNVVGERTTHAA